MTSQMHNRKKQNFHDKTKIVRRGGESLIKTSMTRQKVRVVEENCYVKAWIFEKNIITLPCKYQ